MTNPDASRSPRHAAGPTADTDGPTVLVTGGAGAIGANLVRALLGRGRHVIVLDDLSSGRRENLPSSPELTFLFGSITDEDSLRVAFAPSPAVVINLAACFANQNSIDHPERDLKTNALGVVKLLERVKGLPVHRFVQASSSCVYGGRDGQLSETMPPAPETPYAISKLAAEHYVRFYTDHFNVPGVTLRYFNAYGPFDRPGRYRSVIPNFVKRATEGRPLLITGTGEETRDFTHVSDIVRGTLLALDRDEAVGGVFNIGSSVETRILELAQRINDLTGNAAGLEYAGRRAWDQVSRRWSDISRAQTMLGYTPAVALADGLREYVDWFRTDASPGASPA